LSIRTLLLPAVFDDTREDGLRDGLLSALNESNVVTDLTRPEIGRDILAESKGAKGNDDLAGLDDTPQKIVEASVTNWLTDNWALWKARPEMRGDLFRNLYFLRNSAFGITAQSKRKIIPGRYVKNLAALEATLKDCSANNIHVVLYIAPLRDDVAPPYVPLEYGRFKKDVRALAGKYGAVFANLEHLVPGKLWGSKDATSANGAPELDFMHFQAGGHRLLAGAMLDLLQQNHFLGEKK